jgi:hypothetical protein
MNESHITLKEIQEAASQQTRELREMARTLSFWLDGVHYPSEGQYLEYAVRSYLRRRIPRRFEISTGFISALEANTQTVGEPQATRKVSRQFDILIWDADTYPPLFRADDFVIVMPESVRAVIEITKCLDAAKMREDLEKFDDLYELYSWERRRFRPYTAMLAFSSKRKMKDLLQILERFYLFNSIIPVPFRYSALRGNSPDTRTLPLPSFIDSICVLERGLIKGGMEPGFDPIRSVVRYFAYANEPNINTSFGFFERDVVFQLSQSAARASGSRESSIDIYREFIHTISQEACGSLIIEDWDSGSILRSLNVTEKLNSITSELPNGIENVSNFVGADFDGDHPSPSMNIEYFGPNIWAFERHPENIFACGSYEKGVRAKSWRIFSLDRDLWKRLPCCEKIGEKSFLQILEDHKHKATALRDNPENID